MTKPPKRLGDQLLEMGLITQDQLEIAITEQKQKHKPLGQLFTELGFVTEAILRDILSKTLGSESIDLSKVYPDKEAMEMIPKPIALRHKVMPYSFDKEQKKLFIAMSDTMDVILLDKIKATLPSGVEITPAIAGEGDITNAIDQFYGYELSVNGILKEIETGVVDYSTLETEGEGYSKPLIRLVNAILIDAVKKNASDIHFEPEARFLRLRYRIDGVLRQIRALHKDYWSPISVRLKVLSGMNIAETRSPQDGKISMSVAGRTVDFRVASQPTTHGENIVLRVLDRARGIVPLDNLDVQPDALKLLKLLMSRPEGIILVTGPTGSGKTTTLYSMLNYRKSEQVNIMTLEDPVEYPMELIRQTSINEVAKMDFADGIRSLMRQDPDIILVGEVRDEATAQNAFRAAMTGHQVFTTLHTNSALGAFSRLIDIGVRADLMAGNIIGIIGQRLIRKLCKMCKKPRAAEDFEKYILGVKKDLSIYDSVGCEYCDNTGFKGRSSVIEILQMNDEIDELILQHATIKEIRSQAFKSGYKTMADDGIARIIKGETTIEELGRVVDLTKRLTEQ